jgi:hypothetical protein
MFETKAPQLWDSLPDEVKRLAIDAVATGVVAALIVFQQGLEKIDLPKDQKSLLQTTEEISRFLQDRLLNLPALTQV